MRNDIVLEDTTLRDGEQTPGLALGVKQKQAILEALLEAGVRSVEVGIPAMGGDELEFLKLAVNEKERARLVAWNRGVREDVMQSIDLGFNAVHIGLPTSKLHLDKSVRRDREWLVTTATDLVKMAKDRGAYVSISAEDIARTEPAFLEEYAGVVAAAGADRLRLSDTVGLLTPEQYGERVALIVAASDIDVQCHTHNDFGFATANTMAGLQNGARFFHTTINGIGERAGMSDMAQVVVALKKLYDVDLGIDLNRLTGLSQLLWSIQRLPGVPWQPIVGSNVFAHESGIHVNAMLRDTSTFEPFPPEDVGNERRYVLGKHSGKALLQHLIEHSRGDVDADALTQTLSDVRSRAVERGGPIEQNEMLELYASHAG